MLRVVLAAAASLISLSCHAAEPADHVLVHARIYTADRTHSVAAAMATRGGQIIYVGAEPGARALVGPRTVVEDGGGRLVLPGLVDAHIHPLGIVDMDTCTLDSRRLSLEAMAPFIQDCIKRYAIKPGEWVTVEQWNFTGGNEPSPIAPTLRGALDRASTSHPVVRMGNDGHHAAFNSMALARAKSADGRVIGLTRASLRADFADYRKLVGVDAEGEPDGSVNEDARNLLGAPDMLTLNFTRLMQAPERVSRRLSSLGITAVQDAMAVPGALILYDTLAARKQLNQRVNLVQFYQPESHRTADGQINYAEIVSAATAMRRRYAEDPLIRADAVKIFADGVLEGNPYANPPTLPESASINPYLQPIFGRDGEGKLTVNGYVDLDSTACKTARLQPEFYEKPAAIIAFSKANGFHPDQCIFSSGKLAHDRQVILDYAKNMHLAGFVLHIHAIGDGAVKTAVDAIEGARAADGITSRPDTLAHLQVVSPEDVARIGRDHLFVVYTYSWAVALPEYDMSVAPFFDRVNGNGFAALHNPDSYYWRQFYPAKSTRDAGAILAAGSDAPVEARDPQPFFNIQVGITRADPSNGPANPRESLTIVDLIDAYTINGARAMGRDAEFGSLELGKSADYILLDQDIVDLAGQGRAAEIGKTRVLETWFRGEKVYDAPSPR